MISTEARKFIVRLIIVCAFYSAHANATACDSNKKLYTEIGCTPVYGKDSSSCPVAYNCENVFSRPNDKCYFNGNVYEPLARLSDADSALNPCLAACFCDQRLDYNNKTITKFTCAHVECPSSFHRLSEPCYYQYDRDSCCSVKTFCPEEKAVVHECNYDGNVYKKGQRIYIGNDAVCVCSESFNGTVNDESCRKTSCYYELLYSENVLKQSAPVFYKKADGCPIEWFHPYSDIASFTTSVPSESATSGHVCKYGDLSIPLGQTITIGGVQGDADTYKTSCSCSVPPFVTCIKTELN